ncbi:MAG: hypothetical protein JNL96_09370 [Planctomycetaceae bacterium]|nr:hypothetical protein [Planctomycetaceae bacterium]
MRPHLLVSSTLILAAALVASADADPPSGAIAEPVEVLLDDHFERTELGEWKPLIGTFTVEDGVLKGKQTRADHGAVGRFYRPMRDVVVEFKFRLDGSTGFNAVFDDQKFKGSHAGHICRVAFTPTKIRLADDKEGAMRNDIELMRKDPARKAEAAKLLVGRDASAAFKFEQNRWYAVRIELLGDRLQASVDGKPLAKLESPGIAHETKSSFHFTVNGPGVSFDDVKIATAGKAKGAEREN